MHMKQMHIRGTMISRKRCSRKSVHLQLFCNTERKETTQAHPEAAQQEFNSLLSTAWKECSLKGQGQLAAAKPGVLQLHASAAVSAS